MMDALRIQSLVELAKRGETVLLNAHEMLELAALLHARSQDENGCSQSENAEGRDGKEG